MTQIQDILSLLINNLSSDKINREDIVKNWKEYCSMFPDLARAMSRLQNEIIKVLMEKEDTKNDVIIKLGQMMENLRWSINHDK